MIAKKAYNLASKNKGTPPGFWGRVHAWVAYKLALRRILQDASRGKWICTIGVSPAVLESVTHRLQDEGFFTSECPWDVVGGEGFFFVGWQSEAEDFLAELERSKHEKE